MEVYLEAQSKLASIQSCTVKLLMRLSYLKNAIYYTEPLYMHVCMCWCVGVGAYILLMSAKVLAQRIRYRDYTIWMTHQRTESRVLRLFERERERDGETDRQTEGLID